MRPYITAVQSTSWYSVVLLMLLCGTASKAIGQTTRLRQFYVIKENNLLGYYGKKKVKPASRVVITKTTTGTGAPVTVRTETLPTSTDSVDKQYYSTKMVKSPKLKFTARHEKDTVFLAPLPFKSDSFKNDTTAVSSGNAGKYFISIGKDNYLMIRSRGYELGLLTVPARIHTGNSSKGRPTRSSLDAGAALYFGPQIGRTNFYTNGTSTNISFVPSLFLGVASIALDSTNTTSDPKLSAARTEAALTGGLAFLIGRNDLMAGLAVGRDFPLTSIAKKWDYADALYFGLVLSLKIAPFK